MLVFNCPLFSFSSEQVKLALLPLTLKECVAPTEEAILKLLVERVQTNLHVILCMTPIRNAFR